jgi:osmoprotectant transport system permease protein
VKPAPAASPVIEFRHTNFSLPGSPLLLSDLNLGVHEGETLVLLGRSGSGKTTALKLINRLLEPTQGAVLVEGRSTLEWDPIRCTPHRHVIQETASPHFTVGATSLSFHNSKNGRPRNQARVRGCSNWWANPPSSAAATLTSFPAASASASGGSRLAATRPCSSLDEPFGLDPLTRAESARVPRCQTSRKTIVFFVTTCAKPAPRRPRSARRRPSGGTYAPDEFLDPPTPSSPPTPPPFGTANAKETAMNLFEFFLKNSSQILTLTTEHVWLVGMSMLLAVAVGLPLGMALTRWPSARKPILGGANIIQTIPSLALFGFLLPFPWLGARADRLAIVALTLYALLPIIRNTYTGITGVDPAVREAARGMGMTDRQLLFQVERRWPGASSSPASAATVVCVGVATIAAAIADGLGSSSSAAWRW